MTGADAVDGAPSFDAIVLAGGGARRLDGVDKPAQRVGDATMLERVVAAVAAAGQIIVVGPPRPLTAPVRWVLEDPPGGGPVAAVAAALTLTSAPLVVVLAADLPWVAPAVPLLAAAVPSGGRAVLTDSGGRENHLAAVWSRTALAAAVAGLPGVNGAAMRSLAAGVTTVRVADEQGWGQDCDTWDDLAAARARAERGLS